MTSKLSYSGLVSLALFHFCALAAGDATAGKAKAKTCIACHGENGVSANSFWPNINGQKDQYIAIQLKAFRDGARVSPLMTPVAKMLSDQDMENLAAYFSALKD
jgi:cytochrome c553